MSSCSPGASRRSPAQTEQGEVRGRKEHGGVRTMREDPAPWDRSGTQSRLLATLGLRVLAENGNSSNLCLLDIVKFKDILSLLLVFLFYWPGAEDGQTQSHLAPGQYLRYPLSSSPPQSLCILHCCLWLPVYKRRVYSWRPLVPPHSHQGHIVSSNAHTGSGFLGMAQMSRRPYRVLLSWDVLSYFWRLAECEGTMQVPDSWLNSSMPA